MTETSYLIRRAREARGWSQAELGRRAGLDQVRVSKYEVGALTPGIRILTKLADALALTLDQITGRAPLPITDEHGTQSGGERTGEAPINGGDAA
jgi:transcriptional regulator with XRE-family HTH domain